MIGTSEFTEFFGIDWLSFRQPMQSKTVFPKKFLHTKDKKWRVRCNQKLDFGEHPYQFRKDFILVYCVQVQVNLIHYDDTAYVFSFSK